MRLPGHGEDGAAGDALRTGGMHVGRLGQREQPAREVAGQRIRGAGQRDLRLAGGEDGDAVVGIPGPVLVADAVDVALGERRHAIDPVVRRPVPPGAQPVGLRDAAR